MDIKHCALQHQRGMMSEQNEEGERGQHKVGKNGVSSSLRNAPLHSKPEWMQQQRAGLPLIYVGYTRKAYCTPPTPHPKGLSKGGKHTSGGTTAATWFVNLPSHLLIVPGTEQDFDFWSRLSGIEAGRWSPNVHTVKAYEPPTPRPRPPLLPSLCNAGDSA